MIASLAALAATAVLAAPAGAGTFQPAARSGEGELHMVADPREGAWLWYPGADGHEQLRKISETGAVSTVALPPLLQGRSLDFTPLPGGWALASNHLLVAARKRYQCCQSLVVAQRSPTGSWTRPQAVSSQARCPPVRRWPSSAGICCSAGTSSAPAAKRRCG